MLLLETMPKVLLMKLTITGITTAAKSISSPNQFSPRNIQSQQRQFGVTQGMRDEMFFDLTKQPNLTGWIHKWHKYEKLYKTLLALWNNEKLYYFRSEDDCFKFFSMGPTNYRLLI